MLSHFCIIEQSVIIRLRLHYLRSANKRHHHTEKCATQKDWFSNIFLKIRYSRRMVGIPKYSRKIWNTWQVWTCLWGLYGKYICACSGIVPIVGDSDTFAAAYAAFFQTGNVPLSLEDDIHQLEQRSEKPPEIDTTEVFFCWALTHFLTTSI